MARTLYICYFGVREPLVQTQVLPYLRELRKLAVGGETPGSNDRREQLQVSLLTFEPGRAETDRLEFEQLRRDLLAEGIEWDWLPYHKRPSALATAWDIARGAFFIWRRIARYDVLHGRVHVPTLMGALARKLSRQRPKLLFDIRGFFPEEYTDAGIWPENGLLYRGAKRIESWLMKEADGFVVLTEKAKEILFPQGDSRPVEVIPCCVDLDRFKSATPESRAEVRNELGIGDRYTGVYVGAFGGWYMAEETAAFFGAMRRRDPGSFALVLSQSKREMIEPLLHAQGFTESDYFIGKVSSADIPRYLSAADVAVSFIKPCYSKQASSPTKNAEYLAAGLPIVANAGIGDVDKLINENGVGIVVDGFDADSLARAMELVNGLANCYRETARREFDLVLVGGTRYRSVYKKLLGY